MKLLLQIVSAASGLWLAALLIDGVAIKAYPTSAFFGFTLTTQWQIIIMLGIILGLLNYFLRLLLKSMSLPMEIVSLEFFAIVIGMGFLWFMGLIFDEIKIPIIYPLLYTTLIIWALNIVLNLISNKK